jgi:VWFA-related protein
MRFCRSLAVLLSCLLTVVFAVAQDSGDQSSPLPSAPSATLERERREAEPPPPPPAPEPVPSPAPKPTAAATGETEPAESLPASRTTPGPNTVNENLETIRTSVDEVVATFTVTDRDGKFVKDLKQEDFRILDDNKPPVAVRDFRRETGLPLRVGLLVDTSNSIRDRFEFEQDAAVEFLNQTVRHHFDQAFVLGFDTNYDDIVQDFTDSPELLSKGVFKLRPGGGTALYDALYYACRDKLMNTGKGIAVRRAVILLSDGDDNQSRVRRDEVIDMALRADVVIYAISTNIGANREKGDKELQRLAEGTGGRVFFPLKLVDISTAFAQLQDELRSQYAVAYRPADLVRDGRFRSIQIQAVTDKRLKVRGRKGYYTPKD